MKSAIKIGKRGNGLAFRIPKAIAAKFDLKVGDTIDLSILERAVMATQRRREIDDK